jgi:hypothetical protein
MRAFFISSRTTEGKVHPTALSIFPLSRDNLPICSRETKSIDSSIHNPKQNPGSHWNRQLLAIHNGRRRSYIPPGGRPLQQVCRDDE